MKKIFIIILLILIPIVSVSDAWSGEKKDIWSPITPGPFTTFTAPVNEPGKFSIQPLYFFNIARGIFDGEGHYSSLESKEYNYQQQIQLYTTYGVFKCLEVNAQPLWQINYAKFDGKSAESAVFGDFLMNARYCAIEEGKWIPRVTGMFMVKLPTGKYEKGDPGKLGTDLPGTGSTDYTYGLSFTKGAYPIRTLFHLDLFYANSPQPVSIDGIKTKFSDTYTVNGAFEWLITEKIDIMSELNWTTQGDRKLDGNWTGDTGKTTLVWGAGIGYSVKTWQTLVGYQRTIMGENADANDTVAATVIVIF